MPWYKMFDMSFFNDVCIIICKHACLIYEHLSIL
uniref:Uncharacterized protein n=1 Tax=Arundo donax TaxID=35708 RepID=A0A0A8Y8R8_ARUDO